MKNWTTVITAENKWLDFDLKQLSKYKDLIYLFAKRNFIVMYKQTILGPLWFILNPLFTTVVFTLIFGRAAGLSTDGAPQFAFYLCSTALWQYFATCVEQTTNTFIANSAIFGKVYFPRVTMPIATVLFSLVNFVVVFVMSLITNAVYIFNGASIKFTPFFLLIPVLVLQTALLSLGVGIIISSLTTKYRDLQIAVGFGIQLWMFATPVVYSLSQFSDKARKLLLLNPVAPIIHNFRYAMMGCGYFEVKYWIISIVVTLVVLLIGLVLFNHVEKTFMDTV